MQAVGLLRELGYRHVRHYAGGGTEWGGDGGPRLGGGDPRRRGSAGSMSRGPSSRPLRAERPEHWGVRLLDALANSSFATLVRLWLVMVLGCGAVYWTLGFVRHPSLLDNGQPVPLTLEGLGSA